MSGVCNFIIEDNEAESDLLSSSSVAAKCGGMAVMFILPFLFGLAPIKASKMSNAVRFTSIASCFGGGVFFGTCFTHLIPEVAKDLTCWISTIDNRLLESLPLSGILECFGFLTILLVEAIIAHGHSSSNNNHNSKLVNKDKRREKDEAVPLNTFEVNYGTHDLTTAVIDEHKDSGDEINDRNAEEPLSNSNGATEVTFDNIQKPNHSSYKRVGILIFALAIHSIFEGLAVGIVVETSTFLYLTGAVLIHKCVVAFALGTKLIEAQLSFREISICLTVFCLSQPLGVMTALIILKTLSTGYSLTTIKLVSGLIQGLSTGFFLYITFVEMICDEIRNGEDLLLKTLSISIGVFIITVCTTANNYIESVRHSL